MNVTINDARARSDEKVTFGFWIYLMTDCVLFASLFAVYVVQHGATAGGPMSNDIFKLPDVLIETVLLLVSSFTCGLMVIAARLGDKRLVITGLIVTALLGAGFLVMELREFSALISEGNSWQRSGFLTAFFTLVATHGLHISVGLLWIIVMIVRVAKNGLTPASLRKLSLFSLFWHFLDLIWIFIFTIVYMIGVL